MNKKGDEYFVLPEHLIYIILAIAGLAALLYIIFNLKKYV